MVAYPLYDLLKLASFLLKTLHAWTLPSRTHLLDHAYNGVDQRHSSVLLLIQFFSEGRAITAGADSGGHSLELAREPRKLVDIRPEVSRSCPAEVIHSLHLLGLQVGYCKKGRGNSGSLPVKQRNPREMKAEART
mmetsp:Transcript_23332/g.39272  ORF Transcript_23332/g.39272 Transcript_23332/m.39272 type:complete len:135 (+) Transcript_23332:631-1035(+)